jgi:raffinose/stachyose/melibiose transport system permease protein
VKALPVTIVELKGWRNMGSINIKKHKLGFFVLFGGPACVCFFAVIIVPFIHGLYMTFTNWNGISLNKELIGIQNYVSAFSDKSFWSSLLLTITYTTISVLLINIIGFILAYLVTCGIKGQNFFRASFFTPNLVGGVVLGYVWQFVFTRAMVSLGQNLHIDSLEKSWLSDPILAVVALIIVTVWQYSGYMMLIYIAGLMSVPEELIEASKIDGCNKSATMRYITLPLMVSSFVICIFLSITRCFMAYDVNLALTEGGPFGSTVMSSMFVYQKAFSSKMYGLGQTEAVILFIVCAIVSLLQVYFTKKKEVDA